MAEGKQYIDELLKEALGEYTEQPPAGGWADMEARLDDASPVDVFFGETLAEYKEAPPAKAWTDMEARLGDASPVDTFFGEGLAGYEETPPGHAWDKMEAKLDGKDQGRRKWYWLAAGLIGLLVGSYMFLGERREHKAVGDRTAEAPQISAAVVNTPSIENKVEAPVATETNTAAEEKMPEVTEQKKEATKAEQKQAPEVPQMQVAQQKPEAKQEAAEQKAEGPVVINAKPANETLAKQDENNNNTQQEPSNSEPGTENKQDVVQAPQQSADSAKDDVSTAMNNRQTDVLMNIKRSASLDSAEKAVDQKQEEVVQVADSSTQMTETPVVAKTEDTTATRAEVALPVISAITNKLEEKVREKLGQDVARIEQPVQDAIVTQSQNIQLPPDKLVFTETEEAKQKADAMVDNGSDIGSLASFIGPMPDTIDYQMTLAADEAVAETGRVSEPLRADIFFKAGYERGFDQYTISKFVMAPGLQIRLSDKLGLMLQPAIKVGSSNRREIGETTSYHDVTDSYMDSMRKFSTTYNAAGITTEYIQANYYFKENYDSVVVSHSFAKRAVVEVDMPVMLNYKVGRNVSVYGGPVVTYSSVPKIITNVTRHQGGTLRDTISYEPLREKDLKAAPSAQSHEFEYSTKDYKSYEAAPYSNPTANKLKFGAMAGMSMNVKNNLSVDVSLIQNFSGLNYIPNAGVRNLYLQPYVRFMVGYKLYGNRK